MANQVEKIYAEPRIGKRTDRFSKDVSDIEEYSFK
jgi:hypothetical protein